MTPPFPRPGAPTPDAHQPTPSPQPAQDPSPQNPAPSTPPPGFSASANGGSDPGHAPGPYGTTPPPGFPGDANGSGAPYGATPPPGFPGGANDPGAPYSVTPPPGAPGDANGSSTPYGATPPPGIPGDANGSSTPYGATPPPGIPGDVNGSSTPYGATPPPGFPGAAGESGRTPPQEPPVPEAERTVTDEPYPAPDDLPEAERTVADDVPPPGSASEATSSASSAAEAGETGAGSAGGQRTLAVLKIPADGETTTAPGPELEPDAILPPGIPPQAPPEPPHDPHVTTTGPIPRLGSGASFPGGPGMHPPQGGGAGGSSGARRALLVAGGLVAALVLGGGGALAVTQLSGGTAKEHKVADSQPPPTPTQVRPTPTPTPSKTKSQHKPKHVPIDIRDEKTDPKPLTVGEVFPSSTLTLAGGKFTRAKAVVNDHCSLAANGPFATELTRQHCRRIVRATFVSKDKKVAVTTGIAVMPTDAAAKAVLKVQDPAHYEWFRGMKATGAPKIDHAGGFAASTVRGRYICYSYATYVDGHKPAADDDTLKKAGTAFRDSTARPIERRDKH
ncbi:hypothetical protein [Actinoallomurus sp. CA-142502]|uniref:hypothetical protein n=1 Tax=Actinoallomurus sp. CA-142502 TaxID=3239885 RepID=UPI003D8A0C39